VEDAAATERLHGAYASAASLLASSVELTADSEDRARRTVEAVETALLAETPRTAARMLDGLDVQAAGGTMRGEVARLRGKIDNALARDQDTASLLFRAAHDLEMTDPRRARDTYLDGLMAAVNAGSLLKSGTVPEAARLTQRAPRIAWSAAPCDLLLEAFSTLLADGRPHGAPLLRRAVEALREECEPRLLTLGCHAALELFDDEALYRLVTRLVELATADENAGALAPALNYRGGVYAILVGQFDAAARDLQSARRLATAAGNPGFASQADLGLLALAAWRGEEREARALATATITDAVSRGQGAEVGFAQYALAVLYNGLGRTAAALDAARDACEQHAPYVAALAYPELVEAAVRHGDAELAVASTCRLVEAAQACGTDFAAGSLARARALVAGGRDAERLYQESIEHLKRSRARPQLARTKLLYGEWLRRQRRRRDAREQLNAAQEMLAGIGADAFAQRAQTELLASGAPAPAPSTRGTAIDELTPHEHRIALLVAEGASNPEIAEQLFVSVRTVEYHMHKIFRKLDIGSRGDLVRLILTQGE
jgi:DNA-binding CsgD family transcriptional regulator